MAKRNIDAVLSAIGQGRQEASKRVPARKAATVPKKRETVVATFTYAVDFLDQIRRLGLDWRAEGLPASCTREGAVIQALAEVALAEPKLLKAAFGKAKNRKGEPR